MKREKLDEVAKRYGTPAYVFDLDMLRERVLMIRECLGERTKICFAMKANPFLIGTLLNVADCYEVCSPGEFRICEKAQIPMEQIVLSGVSKDREDIDYVLEQYDGKGIYTVESRLHLHILEECAAKRNMVIRALVRVTSGNQFGLDEEDVLDIFLHRNEYPHVEFQGIQYYSGTQKKTARIQKELEWLDELMIRMEQKTGLEIRHLEYGPGFYVSYFEGDEEAEDRKLLEWFAEQLGKMHFDGQITLEMGRYIAAYCGYYLTSIVDRKKNKGQNYCIVDGGIHHLNYYGQMMAMKIPHYDQIQCGEREGREELWNICGSLCTVNDVLVKKLPLQSPKLGDVLVFKRAGAYSVTEGMYLFLSRDMPEIIFYEAGVGSRSVRRKRGTYEINSAK